MATTRATKNRSTEHPSEAPRARKSNRKPRGINPHRGPSVERFLREEGLYEEASARAIKEVLVLQVRAAMKRQGITKVEMAGRMGTSRAALDRLLDSANESVTLGTLFRAASALGADLRVELRGRRGTRGRESGRRMRS